MPPFGSRLAIATLAFASGSLDVVAFLRLGHVFATVMTSNLVFVALAAVTGDGALGLRAAVALGCFMVGVAAASAVSPPSGDESRLGAPRLTVLLAAELAVLLAYTGLWMAAGPRPGGATQLALLGLVTLAMGAQSAVGRNLGTPEAGTTYLTGTLTGVVSHLALGRRPSRGAVTSLLAILAGAAGGALLITTVAPATPLLAVAAVAVSGWLSWRRRPRRGAPSDPPPVAPEPPAAST
ncbi:MAG TPA: YoaK family protein [Acidimicrobiales bacterium]|nr:YoaK family protein [Acidimicrobiales bacterium]